MRTFSCACARKTFTTTSILLSAYLLYRFLFQSEKDTREGISQYWEGCQTDWSWIPAPTTVDDLLKKYPEVSHLSKVTRSIREPMTIHLEFIEPMSASRYCSFCIDLKSVFGNDTVIT